MIKMCLSLQRIWLQGKSFEFRDHIELSLITKFFTCQLQTAEQNACACCSTWTWSCHDCVWISNIISFLISPSKSVAPSLIDHMPYLVFCISSVFLQESVYRFIFSSPRYIWLMIFTWVKNWIHSKLMKTWLFQPTSIERKKWKIRSSGSIVCFISWTTQFSMANWAFSSFLKD